jgi:hypothetical protein
VIPPECHYICVTILNYPATATGTYTQGAYTTTRKKNLHKRGTEENLLVKVDGKFFAVAYIDGIATIDYNNPLPEDAP